MKNLLLKFGLMLAVSVLCQLSLTAQKTVTLQEAINVVKQQDKNSEYLYYYGKVSGVINGACGCHVDASAICSNPWLTSQDSLWVIFVDQKPMCNWEHDCAFVYVPTKVNNLSDVSYFTVKGNRPPRPNIAALTPWGRDGNQNADAYFQMEKEKGFRKNSDWEHAQYCSSPVTIGEDLSFNHIPDSVSLFVRDNTEDTGKEANTSTKVYWNSPDLWTSTSGTLNEGELASLELLEEPITSRNERLYSYVRVTNRGVCDYEGKGKFLHVMWSQPALNQTPSVWVGKDDNVFGGVAASVEISQSIPVGESRIIVVPWQMPDVIYSEGLEQNSSFCFSLLTHISDSVNVDVFEISDSTDLTYTPVLRCRDIAQKTFQFYNPNGGGLEASNNVADLAIMPSLLSKQLTVAVVDNGGDSGAIDENSEFALKAENKIGVPALQISASEKQQVTLIRNCKQKIVQSNNGDRVVHITLTNEDNKLIGGISLLCQENNLINCAKERIVLKIKSIDNQADDAICVHLTKDVPAKAQLVLTSTANPYLNKIINISENVKDATCDISGIPSGLCVVSLFIGDTLVDSKQMIIK